MSYSISTLPIRNPHDIFGEGDAARRRAAIDEIHDADDLANATSLLLNFAATFGLLRQAYTCRMPIGQGGFDQDASSQTTPSLGDAASFRPNALQQGVPTLVTRMSRDASKAFD